MSKSYLFKDSKLILIRINIIIVFQEIILIATFSNQSVDLVINT